MVTFHASTPTAWSSSAVNTSASVFNAKDINKIFLRDGWVSPFLRIIHGKGTVRADIPGGQTMLVGTLPQGFRPKWRIQGVACDTARTSPCYIETDGRIRLYNAQGLPFQQDIPIDLVFPSYPAA